MKLSLKAAAVSIIIAAICAVLNAPAPVRAQQEDNFDLEGTISQKNSGKLTVDTGQGVLFHVVYDDKTTIVGADGKPGTQADFKVGLRVHVLGAFNEAGEVNARRIEIQPAAAPAPSSQSPPQA